jgi:hypothetical protein
MTSLGQVLQDMAAGMYYMALSNLKLPPATGLKTNHIPHRPKRAGVALQRRSRHSLLLFNATLIIALLYPACRSRCFRPGEQ